MREGPASRFTAALLLVLTVQSPAWASAQECVAPVASLHRDEISVRIETSMPASLTDRTKGMREIQAISGGDVGFTLLGFAAVRMFASANTATAAIKLPGGGFCAWPTGVAALVGYMVPHITIYSESVQGTCKDRIIVWHENQHVKNKQAAVNTRLPTLAIRLQKLASLPPVYALTADAARTGVLDSVQVVIESEVGEMRKIAAVGDSALDTLENYRHQFDGCR